MPTISKIAVYALRGPKIPRPHWTSHFPVPTGNEIFVQLHTDDPKVGPGIGFATSYTTIEPLIHPWKTGFAQQIVGEDALAPERLYNKLFNLTTNREANEKGWSREAVIRLSAAVDIACWDLLGKASNLPLYRLFGGFTNKVDCYGTCGYYREGKDFGELESELRLMLEQGHRRLKVKTGGLPLEQDLERLAFIRKVIGDDVELMVDVNRAWDIKTALRAVEFLEQEVRPRWLEEPIRWEDDRRGAKLLSQKTKIPISGGESEITSYGCRALLEEQAIDILQFDVTMYGGFTEGRKLTGLCELNHVGVAPHHDCFIHSHLVASSPAGLIVEAFTDPERDPLQAELFENAPAIIDGQIEISDEPGLGLRVSEKALEKYGERIL
ncbi:hypothetical protein CYMTET_9727 [Cymbomonas tetramitiformis]|uniref:Mandelate racemase/muconate lactonizing enzyme C-terminal domain-containing protein n=1 Tax=Cymbomonas tetramitiformis TaxID=36881 RepID=A0AAE0GQW5_9CHLO|nr:hypothetical protein CYMTET_9727 [Cymbomonas tetramitiformis]